MTKKSSSLRRPGMSPYQSNGFQLVALGKEPVMIVRATTWYLPSDHHFYHHHKYLYTLIFTILTRYIFQWSDHHCEPSSDHCSSNTSIILYGQIFRPQALSEAEVLHTTPLEGEFGSRKLGEISKRDLWSAVSTGRHGIHNDQNHEISWEYFIEII